MSGASGGGVGSGLAAKMHGGVMLSREEIPFGNINDVRATALALYDENERFKAENKAMLNQLNGKDESYWSAVVVENAHKLEARNGELEAENALLRERNEYIESTLNGYRSNAEYCEKYKAENARLRRETQSYKNLIARYEAVKPTNECIEACPYLSQAYANEEALRADNALLREENERLKGGIHPHTQALIGGMTVAAYQTRIQTIEAENESEILRLRAVVEAAKKVAIGVRKQIEAQEAGFVSMGDLVALEAALEGLEGKC